MAQRNLQYTTETMTITYTSLASVTGYRESTAFDNSAAGKLYLDCLVGGAVVVGTLGAGDGTIEIYAYASYDGTNYTAGLSGTDSTITWGSGSTGLNGANDLVLLGVVSVDDTDDGDLVEFGPFSIAEAFGGTVPPKWGVVVRNNTNIAFNATQTGAELQFTGVEETVA